MIVERVPIFIIDSAVVLSHSKLQSLRTRRRTMRTIVSALRTIVVAVSFAVFANAETDYCSLKTCVAETHTVCRYGLLKVNRKRCTNIESSTLTWLEIEVLLNVHNSYRAQVAEGLEHRGNPGPQPPATNLGNLTWDEELAFIAQSWADHCHLRHDQCRDTARFQAGQNIAYKLDTRGYIAKFSDIVTTWYEEVNNFNRNQVKSVTHFDNVSYYTQMMWADTKYLGCGGVRYRNGRLYKMFLVCNYGPFGNRYGEEMYKTR